MKRRSRSEGRGRGPVGRKRMKKDGCKERSDRKNRKEIQWGEVGREEGILVFQVFGHKTMYWTLLVAKNKEQLLWRRSVAHENCFY